MALPDRFEPWHLLVVAAFLVGAGSTLFPTAGAGIAVVDLLVAVVVGLFWAFGVYVFVGTFRNYVASYAETGGSPWNPRFLAPFAAGAVASVAVVIAEPIERDSLAALAVDALQIGFWAFVLAMAAVLVASYVIAGYREAQ
jgi:hypothetical protein